MNRKTVIKIMGELDGQYTVKRPIKRGAYFFYYQAPFGASDGIDIAFDSTNHVTQVSTLNGLETDCQ